LRMLFATHGGARFPRPRGKNQGLGLPAPWGVFWKNRSFSQPGISKPHGSGLCLTIFLVTPPFPLILGTGGGPVFLFRWTGAPPPPPRSVQWLFFFARTGPEPLGLSGGNLRSTFIGGDPPGGFSHLLPGPYIQTHLFSSGHQSLEAPALESTSTIGGAWRQERGAKTATKKKPAGGRGPASPRGARGGFRHQRGVGRDNTRGYTKQPGGPLPGLFWGTPGGKKKKTPPRGDEVVPEIFPNGGLSRWRRATRGGGAWGGGRGGGVGFRGIPSRETPRGWLGGTFSPPHPHHPHRPGAPGGGRSLFLVKNFP